MNNKHFRCVDTKNYSHYYYEALIITRFHSRHYIDFHLKESIKESGRLNTCIETPPTHNSLKRSPLAYLYRYWKPLTTNSIHGILNKPSPLPLIFKIHCPHTGVLWSCQNMHKMFTQVQNIISQFFPFLNMIQYFSSLTRSHDNINSNHCTKSLITLLLLQ